MAKKQWISLLGLWTMVFLFLGFPASLDKWIAVGTGLVIILITYSMSPSRSSTTNISITNTSQEIFVENSSIPKI